MTCDHCEGPVTVPVRDADRVFCSQDCHEAASERYWLRVWAS